MEVLKHHKLFFLIIYCFYLVGCTSGDSSAVANNSPALTPVAGDSPIKDIIDDITNAENAEIKKVTQEVTQLSKEINNDPIYVITAEDESFLVQEGLVEESEIKEWVK
jgi:uncharacterized protein YcfL